MIEIPGSKSYTNRALVMATLTKGPVILRNPLYSEDTEAMISCLRSLGIRIEIFPDRLIVHDDLSMIKKGSYDLFAHDSGTTLRFLLAFLCLVPGVKTIKGNPRLNERPIKDLIDALRSLGAEIEEAPLRIVSSNLTKHEVTVSGALSSQFISALLMISPLLNGLELRVTGESISKSYIDMTVDMMKQWNVNVLEPENGVYQVPSGQNYEKKEYRIEGDFSSAGYFFAMAALNASTVTLKNLNPLSAQPDRQFLSILQKMGSQVIAGDHEITLRGKGVSPLNVDMEQCPDQVQTLAVLAAFAKGITKISGIRSLRHKETERVVALKNELAKMGIKTEDTHDTLTIYGGNPKSAQIETYGDHRMAMAFAVAGTQLPEICIKNPEVVNKTYPEFWDKLSNL